MGKLLVRGEKQGLRAKTSKRKVIVSSQTSKNVNCF
jgi:hypothetical protein